MFVRDLRETKKGSAIPILFVLLVGVAALGFHIYVLEIVPEMVFDAEVESHRATLTDVREFNFAAREAVETGEPQPVVIGDRVDYPVSFPTPPDPRYAVRTSEVENVTIENYDRLCNDDTNDTDGGPSAPSCENESIQQTYNTSTVIFLAQYNQYQKPIVYGYEYGMVYSAPWDAEEGNESVVTYDEQDVINGTNITLYTISDPYTKSDRTVVFTTIIPNGTKTSFTITDDGRPINMTLATEIGESEWRRMMQEEMQSNGGNIRDIQYDNETYLKEENNQETGTADEDHWYSCAHDGQNGPGEPYVRCTNDNSTNYVTFVLEPDKNYTVDVYESELGGSDN